MSDHDALLAAICENPRDDTPRLVFADFLEENGQAERAAFIRTDIAMARRDEWDAERLKWEERDPRQLPDEWTAASDFRGHGLMPYTARYGRPPTRRGLPWAVYVGEFGLFRPQAPALFARHPLGRVAFSHGLPRPDQLVALPWFAHVTSLEWAIGRLNSQKLRPLLESPDSAIAELAVQPIALSADGMRGLFDSDLFPRLTHLSLFGYPAHVIRAAVESLGPKAASCRLRSLTIHGDGLNRETLFAASSLSPRLQILNATSGYGNAEAVRELAAQPDVSGLRILRLTSNQLGNTGAAAIFTSPHLAELKVLDLSYCQVGDEALRGLLDNSPLADGLNLLNLTGSPASAEMKQAVKERMGDRVWV